MKKRVTGWLALAVAVAAGMFAPVTALDAYAEEWTEVSTWVDLAVALNAGSQVKLMQNVSKSADYLTVDTGKTSVLDLNGHTIERLQEASTSYGFVIYVHGGDLTIMDSSAQQTDKITGGFDNSSGKGGGGVAIDSGGHLTLAGGSITGTTALCNGVFVLELADDLGAFATTQIRRQSNTTAISLPVTVNAAGHAVIDFDFDDLTLPSALFLRPTIAVKGIVSD